MLPAHAQVHRTQRLLALACVTCMIAGLGGCSWFFGHAPPDLGVDLVGVDGSVHHVQTRAFETRVTNGLDSTTQNTAVTTDAGPASRAYRGVQIWNLVREYGLAGAPDRHGDSLDRFVMATGSDGYRALFSAGELDPSFGNTHALLAVQTAGDDPHPGPSPFLTTAPLDQRAARYVSSLVRLEVRTPAAESLPVANDSIVIDGAVEHPLTLRRADLMAMPVASAKLGDLEYQGVPLWNILVKAGLQVDASRKGALLTMYAIASSCDGYQVVVSLAEASPAFGNRRILIGYLADKGTSAEPRLVVADDQKRGRSVSHLCRIHIADAASPP